jgi:uncharacterized protein YndB with AHSA1/START domain
MADIIHRVGMKAPIANVYAAVATVNGVAGWWTKQTNGNSRAGDTIGVRFNSPAGKEIGAMTMEVMALEPDKKVHWRFKEGPPEWIGTDVTFDLYQDGDYTILLFGHRNWREPVEFMAHCSMKWATFMLSLKELVETGQGKPAPNDIKIDNWN